jgi:hypothetical protein
MSLITGRGCTLTMGTLMTFAPKITQIGGFGWSRPSIDTSYLGTTGCRTKKGGDLYDLDPITASIFIEPDEFATTNLCSIDDVLYDGGNAANAENMTLTFSDSGAATMVASGHVTGFSIDDIVLDGLVTGSFSIQWEDAPTIAE